MNERIRDWIVSHRQPWSFSPELSVLGGPIGAPGTKPLDPEVADYHKRAGTPIKGRTLEDIFESETLDQYELVISWLPPTEKSRFGKLVGFGAASTMEANACTMPCMEGYAILYDVRMDTLLTVTMDLWVGLYTEPKLLTTGTFFNNFNLELLAVFFHLVRGEKALVKLDPQRRSYVDKALWVQGLFIIAHEVGHIWRGHVNKARTRSAILEGRDGPSRISVLIRSFDEEFEADAAAIDLLMIGETRGLAKPGHNIWSNTYMVISWFFSVLAGIEILAERIGIQLTKDHPPAEQRRERVLAKLRAGVAVDGSVMHAVETYNRTAVEAAIKGPIPRLDDGLMKRAREINALLLSL